MAGIPEYDFKKIEEKWSKIFAERKPASKAGGKKFYLLEMFPYPSGALHMGHMRNYTIGDTYKRFLEMKGMNVFYPMGYDAFGLPAENAAIKSGIHPREWTMKNIENMILQQKRMGLSYDWERMVITCGADYVKWNQWFFLKFLEKGLAYRKESSINWCPGCRTVLANEQVHSGKCWRCESVVESRKLEQWFFKITNYAEELLSALNELDWPAKVKSQQEHWIGKSEGVEIDFPLEEGGALKVFTTRPDTLWGATFMAISAEHTILEKIARDKKDEIGKLKASAAVQSEEEKEKFGVRLTTRAINPVNGEKIPIFAANFVLMEYGTGAIMCVPAHDKRDFSFAKKYGIPMWAVIAPEGRKPKDASLEDAYTDEGVLINSGDFSGLKSAEARKKISAALEKKGIAKIVTRWHLRDWLVSRQRYWGCPIPVVYCEKCGIVPVPEKDLPVLLPDDALFTGEGNPLDGSKTFREALCPKCGGASERETDTLDTFVDSSWYFLRYLDSKNTDKPFSREIADDWMPVNQYIGGIEHATMHLIYARFFTKALRDMGMLKAGEPFKKLLCQGMVLKDGGKMSKSKGNTVSVDDMLNEYGADTGRLFILFASPPEKDLDWSEEGVRGCSRFLTRVWKMLSLLSDSDGEKEIPEDSAKELRWMTAKTVRDVEEDLYGFRFNTAISSIQEFVNFIKQTQERCGVFRGFGQSLKTVITLLHPFAPFMTSEAAEILRMDLGKFPGFSKTALERTVKEIIIEVNGKLRSKIPAGPEAEKDEIVNAALADVKVRNWTDGKEIKKTIYIPGKLLNIVTGG